MLMNTNNFKFLKKKRKEKRVENKDLAEHAVPKCITPSVSFSMRQCSFNYFFPSLPLCKENWQKKLPAGSERGFFYQLTTRLKILYLKCSRGLA